MDERIWDSCGMTFTEEHRSTWRIFRPYATSCAKNPTFIGREVKTGLRGWTPTTKPLSHAGCFNILLVGYKREKQKITQGKDGANSYIMVCSVEEVIVDFDENSAQKSPVTEKM
jgi:hypothetical protein